MVRSLKGGPPGFLYLDHAPKIAENLGVWSGDWLYLFALPRLEKIIQNLDLTPLAVFGF